jgi:hypothetical protein
MTLQSRNPANSARSEATHTSDQMGTVHGAMETGLRAAGEVVEALD